MRTPALRSPPASGTRECDQTRDGCADGAPSLIVPAGVAVAVCGLHAQADTTGLALALAHEAAKSGRPGRVLLAQAGCPAQLATRAGTASPLGLHGLAALVFAGRRPTGTPWVTLAGGLRLLAPARLEAPAPELALEELLEEARAAHDLVVLDAGRLDERGAAPALGIADLVVWCAPAARLGDAPGALASAGSRPARGARWLLAVSEGRPPRAALAALAGKLDGVLALTVGAEGDERAAGVLLGWAARGRR